MTVKLLIVDDNAGDIDLIREALADMKKHFEIQTASTGEEAVAAAREFTPAFAIIDTHLPKMDGFATCRAIKVLLKDAVRVIMITGLIDAVDAVRAREMGADEYCVKTSDYAGLKRCMKALVPGCI